jgi:hypothetical protein
MSKHTPGPWKVSCVGYGARIEPNIAWVGYGSSYPKEEHKANAQLIAAAPDLLEALIGILKNLKINKGQGIGLAPIMKAKSAIALATGKELA